VNIKYVIAHAAWSKGRKQGLSRVLEMVPEAHVLSSRRPEHASTWATRLWDWCAEQDADYVVTLNDDILPHPKLQAIVPAIVEAVGPRLLSMFSHNPFAKTLRAAGHHFYKCYWLTGPIYGASPREFGAMRDWVDAAPRTLIRHINEDNYGIHYAWDRQEPIWTTIPGLATHDTDIPSTLGYDNHPNRNSHVPFAECNADLTEPSYWRIDGEPPYAPNPWMSDGAMAGIRRMIKGNLEVCEMCTLEPAIVKTSNVALGQKCIDGCAKHLTDIRRAAAIKGGQRG